LVVLLMLPFAVAMVVLGRRVWLVAAGPAGDRDLLSDPVSLPAPAPARAGADTVQEHAGTLAGPAARR
jgi:hypothetical protein